MQILIVEDDRSLAAALARILEDNGYTVDMVHNGEQGILYGESGMYDVIILDVMLPKKMASPSPPSYADRISAHPSCC